MNWNGLRRCWFDLAMLASILWGLGCGIAAVVMDSITPIIYIPGGLFVVAFGLAIRHFCASIIREMRKP